MKNIRHFEKYNKDDVNNFYNYTLSFKNDWNKLSWNSIKDQKYRFNKILEHIDIKDSKILDFGCGLGDFIKESNIKPENYIGLDINENFINICKEKYPDYNFILGDIYDGDIDYFIASGAFTIHTSDDYLFKIIDYYLNKCRIGIIFNLFSDVYDVYKSEKDSQSNEILYRGYDIKKIKNKYNTIVIKLDNKYERMLKIYSESTYDKIKKFCSKEN